MRSIIARSIEMKTYLPKDTAPWDEAFRRFEQISK